MPIVLEGLVTTRDPEGSPHLAPMGPHVSGSDLARFTLLPYASSRTGQNLRDTGCGVFHVTDDVGLLARAGIGHPPGPEAFAPATTIPGWRLRDFCRAYEFRVTRFEDSDARMTAEVEVVQRHWLRDFVGFHRARHAVLEAAILATRVHLLPFETIQAELARLRVLVEKTGGPSEHEAFAVLEAFVNTFRPPTSASHDSGEQ